MPIERADREIVQPSPSCPSHGEVTLSTLTNWPVRTLHFALPATGDVSARQLAVLAQMVGSLTEELGEKAIAHNVLVCAHGRSVFVLPRKPQHGAPGDGLLNAALLEICGVAIVHNRNDYDRLTAQTYRELLAEVRVCATSLAAFCNKCAIQVSMSEAEFGEIRESAKRLQLSALLSHSGCK